MPHRMETHLLKETPIERIFQKVMGRKMTAFERICFHLKRRIKPPPQDGTAEPKEAKARRVKMARN
jgi:hypothetical protein